jgi:hypothetical protein
MVKNGSILYFGGLNKPWVLSPAQLYFMGFPHHAHKNPTTCIEKLFYNYSSGLYIQLNTLYRLTSHPPVYAPPERCAGCHLVVTWLSLGCHLAASRLLTAAKFVVPLYDHDIMCRGSFVVSCA